MVFIVYMVWSDFFNCFFNIFCFFVWLMEEMLKKKLIYVISDNYFEAEVKTILIEENMKRYLSTYQQIFC